MQKFKRGPQARWDKRHLVTVSTHLTEREWAKLKAICAAEGVTLYALVRDYLREYMRGYDARLKGYEHDPYGGR